MEECFYEQGEEGVWVLLGKLYTNNHRKQLSSIEINKYLTDEQNKDKKK